MAVFMFSPKTRTFCFGLTAKMMQPPFQARIKTRVSALMMMSLYGDRISLLSLDISQMLDFAESNSQFRDASIFHASALFPF
jgi:hypothetical protein